MTLSSWEDPKTKQTTYGIDVPRFELALKMWMVPRREWRMGWRCCVLVAHALNDATFEVV